VASVISNRLDFQNELVTALISILAISFLAIAEIVIIYYCLIDFCIVKKAIIVTFDSKYYRRNIDSNKIIP
jgi:hypothetical protein